MGGGFIAMNKTIWVLGNPALQAVVQGHTALSVTDLPEEADGNPILIIEPSLGPLSQKRGRLLHLANRYPGSWVLTASTAVLLAQQQHWVADRLRLIGFDPWLMLIDAKRLTIVSTEELSATPLTNFHDWEWDPIQDSVGGVFARVIAPLVNEAVAYREMGLTEEDIDQAIRRGLNHPRGPLEWARIFGITEVGLMLQSMRQAMGDSYLPHPEIQRQMAKEGVDWNA